MMEVEHTEPKVEENSMQQELNTVRESELVRKAFVAMLDAVDLEDVFDEFIVPASPPPAETKESR